jgi:rare lipoprotein A
MQKKMRLVLSLLFFILLAGCTNMSQQTISTNKKNTYRQYGKNYTVMPNSKNYAEQGTASWYGRKFHKKRTSSGERYNMYKLTAAHKTLPVVKVNDRGPFTSNRLIDLSYAAAKKIGIIGRGTAPVDVRAI